MILGIDLGTSMVKAALFNANGACISVASRSSSPTPLGEGRIEQEFEEIVTAVSDVIREACAGHPAPQAIGLTGQSDGLWLIDENARGIRPAVSWLDDRGNPYLQRWIDDGTYEAVYRRNGNAIFPGSHAPLMAALKESDPQSLAQAATASYLKDAILQRLTGVRATDASDTSLPFLDTETREYDPEILRLLGLGDCARLLAPVIPAPGKAFAINAEGAALTGLPEGVPVHAGPFDLPACAMGAGLTQPGDGLIIVGTTLACEVLTNRIDKTGDPVGMTLCMPEDGYWLRALPAMVGTATLDWVLGLLNIPHSQVDALLKKTKPGANGVTALPYFAATGERAPFCDVNARGLLSGLSTATTPADLVRAVCEAIAFAARHCIESAGLTGTVSVCGGGASSQMWSQMIADVLQRPLQIAPRPEVGARGAAIAAMNVLQIDYDHGLWTRPEGVIRPDPTTAAHYERAFAHYLETVSAARTLWHSPTRQPTPQRSEACHAT